MAETEKRALSAKEAYERPWYRWYVLAVLTGVYTFNFIDRQILVILQEPMKLELDLSDKQLGLLSGFSFAIVYVTAGIWVGRWADTGVRRNIIVWALGIWSFMTALSGLAQNYYHLLLARIGVALGESGGSPPSHSMISDMFAPSERATAMSIYSTGINFGGLFGLLAGGWIAQYFGWRIAFFVVGIPGILFAIFVRMTVKEPPRGLAEEAEVIEDAPDMKEAIKFLMKRRSFRHMAVAAGLHAFIGYGAANFAPSFFMRSHGLQPGEVGTWLAAAGIFGAVGTFLGGFVVDKLSVRDARWYLWVPAISTIATLPFSLTIYSLPYTSFVLILNFIPAVVFNMYLAPNLALAHGLVGIRMRAMSSAVLFFILNIIGLGLGPLCVGFVSDFLAPSMGSESLRWALISVVTVINLWCVFHYMMASRHVREDLANAPNIQASGA